MKNIKIKQEILEKYKIILIFGVPCAGKSITTYNTFIKNKNVREDYDLTKLTFTDECILVGYFPQGNRKGLDSIERKQVGQLFNQIKRLKEYNLPIILEGNRCISRPMLNNLIENNYKCLFIMFTCDDNVAEARTNEDRELKGKEQEKIINSTRTMCDNYIIDYQEIDAIIIDTSKYTREDFECLTLNDIEFKEIEKVKMVNLW